MLAKPLADPDHQRLAFFWGALRRSRWARCEAAIVFDEADEHYRKSTELAPDNAQWK